MKIGFDAKRFFFNHTGLGNYSRTLVYALEQYFPDNGYYLYSPNIPEIQDLIELKKHQNIVVRRPEKVLHRAFSTYWRSMHLGNELEKDGLDIYHGLSHELPQNIRDKKVKSVVTIHDLIFLRIPDLYTFIDRQIYTTKFKFACEAADKVIAISEQTKRDIMEYFGTPKEKIEVVYQSCHPIFQKQLADEEKERVKQDLKLPHQFILYVGALNARKNVLRLVKAYEALKLKAAPSLIIVGDGGHYKKQVEQYIAQHQLQNRVKILSQVATHQLPAVYQMARLFVYPSLYEGFGIPIIEALYSGTPVITSKGGCFAEAGGPHSIYIEPNAADELKEAMESVLKNDVQALEMKTKGLEYVQRFNTKQFATDTMRIYRQLAG